METIIDILTTFQRLKSQRIIRRKSLDAQETIKVLRKEKSHALEHGANSFAKIADIGVYLVVLSVDLSVFGFRLLLEQDDLIRKVYSRHLILSIYELVDDFPLLFDKQIRLSAKQIPNSEGHLKDWKMLSEKINEIERKYSSQFKSIRNTIVAHRDINSDKQIEALDNVDCEVIYNLTMELDQWVGQAISLLTKMTIDYSSSFLQIKEVMRKIVQENQQNV
jgi:hypothetical protein